MEPGTKTMPSGATANLGLARHTWREFRTLLQLAWKQDDLTTAIRSVIIDHLEYLSSRNHSKVLSFYFDYKQQSEQTPFKILQTLLHQLLSTYTKVPASIRELR